MLTIIAGRFKGRHLAQPSAAVSRPTMQRTRGAIFNILGHQPGFAWEGKRVLDIYAGSGGMGLEALSRGAAHVTLVENHQAALKAIHNNIASLNVSEACTIIAKNVVCLPMAVQPVDLIFADPPYEQNLYGKNLSILALELLHSKKWLNYNTVIVLETSKASNDPIPSDFILWDQRIYGNARISFLALGGHRLSV